MDTEHDTASSRVRIYVNGLEVTSFSTETNPSENVDTHVKLKILKHVVGATVYCVESMNEENGDIKRHLLLRSHPLWYGHV